MIEMKMKTNKLNMVMLMLLVIPTITIVTTAMTQTAESGYRVDLTAVQLLH
jgi:hypothetical protein